MHGMVTYGTCGRHRRTSSRSSGRSRPGHRHSRRRSRPGHRQIRRRRDRPWGSCGQCDRPHRTECVRLPATSLRGNCQSYLVALLATALAATLTAGRAVTRDVAGLAAPVARLGILRTLRAITAYNMSAMTRRSNLGTVHSLMWPSPENSNSFCQSKSFVDEARWAVKRAYRRSCSC